MEVECLGAVQEALVGAKASDHPLDSRSRSRVKIASSHTAAGMSFIAEQGNYIQLSTGGVKLTKDRKAVAAWP